MITNLSVVRSGSGGHNRGLSGLRPKRCPDRAFGDEIEKIIEFNPVDGKKITELSKIAIYPAKHFIIRGPRIEDALKSISHELSQQLELMRSQNKILEAQRLESRTKYDMEMLKEIGYCHGIENYSRHLSARPIGSRRTA